MPFLTIRIEPYGIGIRPEERLCQRCEHLLFCEVLGALTNLRRAPYAGYVDVAVRACDFFHPTAAPGTGGG